MKVDDDYILTFGKYRGRALKAVPDEYLLWMYEQGEGKWGDGLWGYLVDNIEAIKYNIGNK